MASGIKLRPFILLLAANLNIGLINAQLVDLVATRPDANGNSLPAKITYYANIQYGDIQSVPTINEGTFEITLRSQETCTLVLQLDNFYPYNSRKNKYQPIKKNDFIRISEDNLWRFKEDQVYIEGVKNDMWPVPNIPPPTIIISILKSGKNQLTIPVRFYDDNDNEFIFYWKIRYHIISSQLDTAQLKPKQKAPKDSPKKPVNKNDLKKTNPKDLPKTPKFNPKQYHPQQRLTTKITNTYRRDPDPVRKKPYERKTQNQVNSSNINSLNTIVTRSDTVSNKETEKPESLSLNNWPENIKSVLPISTLLVIFSLILLAILVGLKLYETFKYKNQVSNDNTLKHIEDDRQENISQNESLEATRRKLKDKLVCGEDYVEEVLNDLSILSKGTILHNKVLILTFRWNDIIDMKLTNTLNHSEILVEKAQIIQSTLKLIDKVVNYKNNKFTFWKYYV